MTETMQTPQREENSRFTPEQLAAIRSDGKTIVSASAGSGKTTVMIEKIIRFIVDGGKVSEVLAMTYTKKAAASMKEKLRKALIETINAVGTDKPRKQELKKQLDEVQNADISTIHSFCARLIRSNFYAAGVENDFRIIADDDAEGTALRNAALDELFEDGYENKDEGFAYLLSLYWRNKNDNALREIVLKTYSGVRTRADYKAYLQRSGAYTERTFDAICDDLYKLLCEKCSYYRKRLDLISDYFFENGTPGMQKLCRQLEDMLLGILGAGGYYAAQGLSFEKLSTVSTNKAYSPERNALINKLKALRAKATEIVGELQQIRPRERELADFLQSARTAREIGKCVLRFDEIYARKKNERNILDYGDLEHKALALLSIPEIVATMRERYRYVFVDEYQDVNPVQEDLVKAIGGENVFLVGDVKQAIYGFRGSKSCYFLQKEKEYGGADGNSLKMKFNFRSADAVLDAVNEQFERAMTEETIGVDYQKDAMMEKGGRYENGDGRVLLHVLEKPKNKTDEPMEKPSDDRGVYSVKAHAGIKTNTYSETTKLVRDIIGQELKKTWYDADTKQYRQVRYGDIAILSRTLKGDVPNMIAALSDGGIPVTSSAAVNICQYGEIKTLMDILSYIDNEQQDIPLCSALLSGMGEITLDEIAQIRITYPQKTERYFWSACKRYASEQADKLAQKLLRFYQRSAEYKRLSCVLDAGELLSVILTDTRMEARLLAKDNGTACLRRIHRFIEETYAEEPLSVHAFLERLDALEHKIKFSENGGEDSVQVMTMHSSKGLEFPVVIVIGLSDAFAGKESDAVLIEEDYGLAPRAFDDKNMQTTPTLLRELYDRKKAQSSIADELNLYYVALTRAKYALHMVFKKQSIMQDVRYARSMADFTDFAVWEKYKTEDSVLDLPKPPRQTLVFDPDQGLAQETERLPPSFWAVRTGFCA